MMAGSNSWAIKKRRRGLMAELEPNWKDERLGKFTNNNIRSLGPNLINGGKACDKTEGCMGRGRYDARYPEGGPSGPWQNYCAAAVNKKLCNIKDIINHYIDKTERAYKGTIYEHVVCCTTTD
jgi:hypothetical protein